MALFDEGERERVAEEMADSDTELSDAVTGAREPLFRLVEYATAERRFIGGTLDALARAGDPLLGQIRIERRARSQTTQITTDSGTVVEQQPMLIRTKLTQRPQDIIDGRLDNLLGSLAEAADDYAEQIGKQFYELLGRITEATGNVVDANNKPFFDAIYEMLEKVDLDFDREGNIKQALHLNPADLPAWEKGFAEMTPEQQRQLAELIDRKREEFNARQRSRRLPRRGH